MDSFFWYTSFMNLTWLITLQSTPDHAAPVATMERAHPACRAIAPVARRERTANTISLQKLIYREIHPTVGLSTQMTLLAISRVAEANQRGQCRQPIVRSRGAMVYDQRLVSWKGLDQVSKLIVDGRQIIAAATDRHEISQTAPHKAAIPRTTGGPQHQPHDQQAGGWCRPRPSGPGWLGDPSGQP
jgi:hypothetical protein